MRNDPGAWGSRTPEYLVLGFSKGATQSDIYKGGEFDEVAFGGTQTRRNLTAILRTVSLLEPTETVDEHIRAGGNRFHFGSLVRCSLARRDPRVAAARSEAFKTSGALINRSFSEIPEIIQDCSSRFLAELPNSVKGVLVLGTADAYIKNISALFKRIDPKGFRMINAVVYRALGASWIHLTHPSTANGYLSSWLRDGVDSKSGYKRELAIAALQTLVNS